MKKTSLILIACLATVFSACESGVKTDEIKEGERSIAMPSAPKKPAPKKPEEKKPDEVAEKPDGEKKPSVEEKIMTGVRTGTISAYDCEHCGKGGKVDTYLCPRDYVVTGYELDTADFVGHTIVKLLRLTCVRPTPLNIDDPKLIEYAEDSDGSFTASKGSFVDYRADRCEKYSGAYGVATGILGRAGERLDSIGFFCGSYSTSKTAITVHSGEVTGKTTLQRTDSKFGGAPGIGGDPFSFHCPEGKVIVGLGIRREKDVNVNAVETIYCADLEPILVTPLFPVE